MCIQKGQAITSVHTHQILLSDDYGTSFSRKFFSGISSRQRHFMFPHGEVEASLGIGDPANSQVYLMLLPFYSSVFITEFHIYILPPSITLCSFS